MKLKEILILLLGTIGFIISGLVFTRDIATAFSFGFIGLLTTGLALYILEQEKQK